MSQPLVSVRDLKMYFPIRTGFLSTKPLKAVDGISFSIDQGETLGLVGESGCGKTTVGRALLHLYKPTSGEVWYDGTRITEKNIREYRKYMQIVFQDPYSSLNPRMTVSDIIGEPLDIHHLYKSRRERADRVAELLDLVGLDNGRGSALRARLRSIQSLLFATSRFPRSTCRFRRRLSTRLRICRKS
jgi:oligopeptide transport system ATP-binding protein